MRNNESTLPGLTYHNLFVINQLIHVITHFYILHHAYSYRLLHHTITRLASYNDPTALNSYSSYAGIDVRITTILRTWNSYSDKPIVHAAKINNTCN